MPIIVAQKDGTCRACGKLVRKGEEADYTAEQGLAHPEPQCSAAPALHRPNRRAGQCRCGASVPAGAGRLRLLEDRGAAGGGKSWAVDCAACAGL
ncbi:hypothetical protein JQX13_38845 [Archangium violaceum]|uniref:hypothetical protein n=1 Tax=Archangium violaceum TaxID=83451 RepID=UPI00193BDB37|nr:hypothetical protein [Archangium violaceum]QRK06041.1 hypothetical protein JQX13_38845 [Archangium violaceum]